MNTARSATLASLAPWLFVLLWSTGFIGAKFGLPDADPGIFLAVRFSLTVLLMVPLCALMRREWPRQFSFYRDQAIVGIVMHGGYLGGVFTAIWLGLPASTSAIIVGLQPVLTALLAVMLLDERLRRSQWLGLVFGFIGVVLVIGDKQAGIGAGQAPLAGIGFSVLALLGISLSTIYQKRCGTGTHLLVGSTVQFAAAMVVMWPIALLYGTTEINWTPRFILTMLWLVVVLSILTIMLLMWLIHQGAASKVASLFYLVPPLVALETALLFGERLGLMALAGLALVMAAVWLVRREPEQT